MIGTVHVCAGCDHQDRSKRGAKPAGAELMRRVEAQVQDAGLADRLDIAAYACLGNCERRFRMSVGGPGRWSWLLGDLEADAPPPDLAVFLERWIAAPDGFLPKEARPLPIRRFLIGRVPPDPTRPSVA